MPLYLTFIMSTAAPAPPPVEDDRNRGPELMAAVWTQCGIALVFVSLRCYARILIKSLGKDDWIMVTAAVCAAQDFEYRVTRLIVIAHILDVVRHDDAASTQWRC